MSNPASEQRLGTVRERIDAIDGELLRLISERAKCATEVARIKLETGGQGGETAFYRPEREAAILRRVREQNPGPLAGETVARLFREVISACLALEQPMRVAYLGPEGTYTHSAALKQFGHAVEAVPCSAIDEIFRQVEARTVDFGVVPVENSTEGVVSHTLDMFLNSPLKISGEVELRVNHCLLSRAEGTAAIRRVYAHQQALAQCRRWLDEHLGQAERIPLASNAEAARLAAGEAGAAAIASQTAAEIYQLPVLAANIEDEPNNTTRFLVIGRHDVPPSGQDKTTLLLSTANRPGALHRMLEPLASSGISMTRIESRPSRRGTWDYVFFVDVEGHREEPRLASALQALQGEAAMVRVLGSYQRSPL